MDPLDRASVSEVNNNVDQPKINSSFCSKYTKIAAVGGTVGAVAALVITAVTIHFTAPILIIIGIILAATTLGAAAAVGVCKLLSSRPVEQLSRPLEQLSRPVEQLSRPVSPEASSLPESSRPDANLPAPSPKESLYDVLLANSLEAEAKIVQNSSGGEPIQQERSAEPVPVLFAVEKQSREVLLDRSRGQDGFNQAESRDMLLPPYVSRFVQLTDPNNQDTSVQEKQALRALFDEEKWGDLLNCVLEKGGNQKLLTLGRGERWIRIHEEDVRKYESFKSAGTDRICQPLPRDVEVPPHFERLLRILWNVPELDANESVPEPGYEYEQRSPSLLDRLLQNLRLSAAPMKNVSPENKSPEMVIDQKEERARVQKQQKARELFESRRVSAVLDLVELVTEDLDEENSRRLRQNKTPWREAPWQSTPLSYEDEIKYGPFLRAVDESLFVNPKYSGQQRHQKKEEPEFIDEWLSKPSEPPISSGGCASSAKPAVSPESVTPDDSSSSSHSATIEPPKSDSIGKQMHELAKQLFGTSKSIETEQDVSVGADGESFPAAVISGDAQRVRVNRGRRLKKGDPMKGLKMSTGVPNTFLPAFTEREAPPPDNRSFYKVGASVEDSEPSSAGAHALEGSLNDFLSQD